MKTTLPWAETHRSKRMRLSVWEWTQSDSPFFARIAKKAGVSERTVRGVLARQPYAASTINRVVKAIYEN